MMPEPTPQFIEEKPFSTLSGIPVTIEITD
jgi:hypothetical protein